jgi:hypothetical protein
VPPIHGIAPGVLKIKLALGRDPDNGDGSLQAAPNHPSGWRSIQDRRVVAAAKFDVACLGHLGGAWLNDWAALQATTDDYVKCGCTMRGTTWR